MPLEIIIDYEILNPSNPEGKIQYVFKKDSDGLNRMDIYCGEERVYGVKFKYL
jgi:hypothetical protein